MLRLSPVLTVTNTELNWKNGTGYCEESVTLLGVLGSDEVSSIWLSPDR